MKILITGASRGIGAATARLFAQQGWSVGGIARSWSEQIDGLSGPVKMFDLDIRDSEKVSEAVKEFCGDDALDVLVCNAGETVSGEFLDVPLSEYASMIQTNLLGTINTIYSAVPHLRKSQRSLVIVSSSLSGLQAVPYMSAYSATKMALVGLVQALQMEFEKDKIQFSILILGKIDTPGLRQTAFWYRQEGDARRRRYFVSPTVVDITQAFSLTHPDQTAQTIWSAYQKYSLYVFSPPGVRLHALAYRFFPTTMRKVLKYFVNNHLRPANYPEDSNTD